MQRQAVGEPSGAQPTSFLAVDLESTGFNPVLDRIVEFCFIQLDAGLRELGRWTARVNPGVPIPEPMVQVHGIRNEDVADLPPFASWARRIQRLLRDATLLAYNAPFDRQLLDHELRRAGEKGLRPDHPTIDPLRIYRTQVPDQYRLSGAVRHYLRRRHERWHSAEADAEAAVDVYRAQVAPSVP